MKLLVLSDLHLGSKATKAPARLDAIARIAEQYDRVILNGDTLDRCYLPPERDESAQRWLDEVRRRCASRNGPPELLTGNHDPAVSEQFHVYHAESGTLIFHGDCIRDCTHPTKRAEKELMVHLSAKWASLGGRPEDFVALHTHFREVQRRHLPIINPYKKAKTALEYALSLVYPPRRPFDILYYWAKAPSWALKLAKGFEQPVKAVVVGHTHKGGKWRFDGVDVYNTGSHMPLSDAYGVCLEGEKVEFKRFEALASSVKKVFGLRALSS